MYVYTYACIYIYGFLVCRYARSLGLTARQITPATDGAMHHAPKGISSKNDRVKAHSDGPSLVLSWSISQLVNYHVRCVSFSFRLFIWYLRYGIVGTFRYGGDKIWGADGAAAREPGTIYCLLYTSPSPRDRG